MLSVYYSQKPVRRSGGPALHIIGSRADLRRMADRIRKLQSNPGHCEMIRSSKDVRLRGIDLLVMTAWPDGKTVAQVEGREVLIDLSCERWLQVLETLEPLSVRGGFDYVDLEEVDEDATVVVESVERKRCKSREQYRLTV
jgi:hypothetical protein